jgi:hypothetical protein
MNINTNTNTNNKIIFIVPVRSYPNADLQKKEICIDNKNKTGIYR